MTNIRTADFRDRGAPAGFRSRRARIGDEPGTESIGASVWEVPPGEAAYPYHFHLSDEALVIVLFGRLLNRTQEVVRFLSVSSSGRPDIVVYPDSDKIGAAERLSAGGGLSLLFRRSDAVDYWDGEVES